MNVEALGLTPDGELAVSSPTARLATGISRVGRVSPFALAQTVMDAVKLGRRTPTAAAFQLVEILACLKSARSFAVSEKLSRIWAQHLENTTDKIAGLFRQLASSHGEVLATNKAFGRYQKAVLAGVPRLEL